MQRPSSPAPFAAVGRSGRRPTIMRPQLVMHIGGSEHVVEFTMPEDLAAGMLGAVIAGEWYDQLVELGATPATTG